jgi:hypothetical protein
MTRNIRHESIDQALAYSRLTASSNARISAGDRKWWTRFDCAASATNWHTPSRTQAIRSLAGSARSRRIRGNARPEVGDVKGIDGIPRARRCHFPATVGGDRRASADCRGRRWSAELRSVSDQAAANYRKRAAECAAAASTTKNPETRTQLVMLAEKWVKLAEQREHSVATHGTGPPRQPRER